MGKYEIVRDKIAKIYPYAGMAKAEMQNNNYSKAVEYAVEFLCSAYEIYSEYPNMIVSLTGVMNSTQVLTEILETQEGYELMYNINVDCFLKAHNFLGFDRTEEISTQSMVVILSNCTNCYLNLYTNNKAVDENPFAILSAWASLLYLQLEKLKRDYPNNAVIGSFSQFVRQLDEGGVVMKNILDYIQTDTLVIMLSESSNRYKDK